MSKTKDKKKNKKEKEEKKEKSNKKEKVILKHSKAIPSAPINPVTGSRFAPGTARQLALDVVIKGVKEGRTVKEIRDELDKMKKENGCKFDLDGGYMTFGICSHPEYFEAWRLGKDTTVKLVKKFKPDPQAAKKVEKEKAEKLARAKEARAKRKGEKSKKKDKKDKKDKKKKKNKDK